MKRNDVPPAPWWDESKKPPSRGVIGVRPRVQPRDPMRELAKELEESSNRMFEVSRGQKILYSVLIVFNISFFVVLYLMN